MRPLTYLAPKSMLPIGGEPLLQRTIHYLSGYGIKEFVICVAYLKKQIMEYLGDGSSLGVDIRYGEADLPLGTAGQLKTAEPFIHAPFLAMNGDIVTTLNISNLIDSHKRNQPSGTIAMKNFEVKVPYGYIDMDSNSHIRSFKEKPTFNFSANAGVYILDSEIFYFIRRDKPQSLETDIFPELIRAGRTLNGYYEDAYWADVGSISDFERVDNELIAKQKEKFEPLAGQSVITASKDA